MAITERHMSPDRTLELVVDFTCGDWTISVNAHGWHTHGDILYAWGYEGTPEQATRSFVDDVIASRRPIVIYTLDGRVTNMNIPTRLDRSELDQSLARYGVPRERYEVRYWNGTPEAG